MVDVVSVWGQSQSQASDIFKLLKTFRRYPVSVCTYVYLYVESVLRAVEVEALN